MSKKDKTTDQNALNEALGEIDAAAEVVTETSEATGRAKRISTSIVYPSAENTFTLSIDVAVAGTDTIVNFSHQVPEMSESDARAIAVGYASRLGASVASLKDTAVIITKLNEEVIRLTNGTFIVKGGGNARSVFPDVVYAMALDETLSDNGQNYREHGFAMLPEVQVDTVRLSKWLKVWNAQDDEAKKVTKTTYRVALGIYSTFKAM